ncbi:hypothetical protein [Pseudarthrobacter sp. NPDC058119]|uniref:hypothetical protein n=1 Tax=Pseudarthrobacter sp. NPDC058119 TaxID=3346348 RepID=UPI0036D79531
MLQFFDLRPVQRFGTFDPLNLMIRGYVTPGIWGRTVTEHDPASTHPAAEKLQVAARLRDQELDYLDAEYAKALASGAWNPLELYARYIQTWEAAAARHTAALTNAHSEYVATAGVDVPAIAGWQVPAPYPAPGRKAPKSGQSQLHEWQTPVSHQAGSRTSAVPVRPKNGALHKLRWVGAGILAVVPLAAVSSIGSAGTKPKNISPMSDPISTTRTVTYEVVGGAKTASITYETTAGTSQATVAIPLKTRPANW